MLNDVSPSGHALGKKHGFDMGTKTHSNIMHLFGRGIGRNLPPRCRHLVAISEIQVARGASHHLS